MKIEILYKRLAKPAQRAIQKAGIETLEQLSNYSETEIYDLHGIGTNAMNTIREILNENGLAFSDNKNL